MIGTSSDRRRGFDGVGGGGVVLVGGGVVLAGVTSSVEKGNRTNSPQF